MSTPASAHLGVHPTSPRRLQRRCGLAVVVAAVAMAIADVNVGPVIACTLGKTNLLSDSLR